jgi:beta-lactamase regulating signal transducer with metallopeptidase domain
MEAIAWVLVHFLWQGAAIALAAFAFGWLLRTSRPETRYAVYGAALALMIASTVATFLAVRDASSASVVPAQVSVIATLETFAPPAPAAASALRVPPGRAAEWLPLLVRIWLAGVVLLSLRSALQWALAQRLKVWRTQPAPAAIEQAVARLREKLSMRRAVRVLHSAVASVPSAVGWLKPVILLPASTLTVLSPEQLEMILAHELAHIRRHDYLVNLVQTAVETLLFYHPAVWWLSGRLRAEREHCCDDIAIAATGSRAGYARALAALEGIEPHRSLAVAADGASLLRRIQRLSRGEGAHNDRSPAWLSALIPAAIILISFLSTAPAPQAADPAPDKPAPAKPAPDKPMPAKSATDKPAPAKPAIDKPVSPRPAPDKPTRPASGFLGGLTDAGYTNITVDEIIALKEHGVDPGFIKEMLAAGLGALKVKELIRLREHGVDPEFVAGLAKSGLIEDLSVDSAIRMRENGVDTEDIAAVRQLGFGPYPTDDVIKLRQHGVDESTFAALKEAGAGKAGVVDAIQFRENGVTVSRVREMKRQGFGNLNTEQIIKLCRAGVI